MDGEFLPSIPPSFLHFSRAYIAGLAKVQAGAEIDHGPVTPLHLAARHGHLEACKAFHFRIDKLGGLNILLMVQKSGNKPFDMVVYPIILHFTGFYCIHPIHPRWLALGFRQTINQYFQGEQCQREGGTSKIPLELRGSICDMVEGRR